MSGYRDSRSHWGWVTRWLHWLLAVALFGQLALGFWMVQLDYYDRLYRLLPDLHRSMGVLLTPWLLLRILWRMLNPRPRLTATPGERILALFVQAMLLLVPILMIVSGYLLSTADGRPVAVFDWFEVPAPGLEINRLEDQAGLVHGWLAWLLMGLILLHVAGALKHHFLDRDATLKRMLGEGGEP